MAILCKYCACTKTPYHTLLKGRESNYFNITDKDSEAKKWNILSNCTQNFWCCSLNTKSINVELTVLPLLIFFFMASLLAVVTYLKTFSTQTKLLPWKRKKTLVYHRNFSKYPFDFTSGDSYVGITGKWPSVS